MNLWVRSLPFLLALFFLPLPAQAQSPAPQTQSPAPQASQTDQQLLSTEQLDALLAPIALYPDALLALVLAAVFIVLLLIGEAALFAHAVKTMPDFLSQADVQVP